MIVHRFVGTGDFLTF